MEEPAETKLDVKHAIALAKAFVRDTFGEDGIVNIGLEEINYDETEDVFQITVGFTRKWDQPSDTNGMYALLGSMSATPPKISRTYKRVFVRQDGRISRVENRSVSDSV